MKLDLDSSMQNSLWLGWLGFLTILPTLLCFVFSSLCRALMEPVKILSMVPLWKLQSIAEEEEQLSRCLCDDVSVVSPGQVLADVDPREPEAADSLHRSAIDGEGCVFLSLWFL